MFAKNVQIILRKNQLVQQNLARFNATAPQKPKTYEEIRIKVPWGHLAGKWWGPQDKRPILCAHGWQDNSGSFDTLIHLLPDDIGYLAIDFPGHGLSSRLPHGMVYHGIDNSILMRRLQTYFGWPKLSLLGHSMGGILSFMHTALFPDTVDLLMCVDALKPFSQVPGGHIKTAVKNIDKFIYYDNLNSGATKPPTYSYDDIVNKLHLGTRKSIYVENCKYILERSLEKCPDDPNKYYFSRDSRLKCGTLTSLQHDDIIEHGKRVACPHIVLKATQSPYFEKKEYFYMLIDVLKKTNKDFEFHYVEGTHHVHLNEPEKVAVHIRQFLEKHDKNNNRDVGGIKQEIKVS